MKCPKCGYERRATDTAPEWQCPSCHIAYIKAQPRPAQAQPAVPAVRPDEAKASATRKELEELEQDERLSLAAKGQKIVIYCILLNFVLRAAAQGHVMPDWAILAASVGVGIYSLLGVVKICSGLGRSQNQKILFMVLSFFPLINLVVLVYLSVKTTRVLKEAGWSVGLLGART